jgi:hypothetical protein
MNNLSMIIDGVKYKTGDKVQCRINNEDVLDAKIYISNVSSAGTSDAYICQNEHFGRSSPDLLGYHRSWKFIVINNKNISDTMLNLCNLNKYNCFENILIEAFPGS